MEPITYKEKIEAALNNEAVTNAVNIKLNHPYSGSCFFSDDLMSDGEKAILTQRLEVNSPKIAACSARLGILR